ncbi:lipopolysaccharide core heptose(I) kinase RfaP [Alkalilimnicola sp. S0819]|uniref:lipopolysaccharide core heptose(I) kinase RfaP n=1 Tax=Alkalilimnicola sp. S0819 TaxID=2613922 RepID=UPI00126191E7|nr:lipopolysaccharide core heptose(I) kinase RfaP [Alkalilimnicola sp. S0819]KAB7627324.1 lipopolysaccharide core heptose(I) kinase RfaP [Alkalilimnicola sp. S0819]MPQ16040.1 lipopolysaccharide core heptose(I) kinase RfaP [Alkalilimnicola sp. S0819]
MIRIEPPYRSLFAQWRFEDFLALEGQVYKRIQNRRTLRFEREGRGFFIKVHRGVGWREVFKNLSQGKLPVLGAGNEWRAIRRLHALGLDTMREVALGVRGLNPAAQESFLVTEELAETLSLEQYAALWATQPPAPAFRRALIKEVARIARVLHGNGVNHRDFYICHLLMDRAQLARPDPASLRLYVIDLHRAQCRRRTPRRWVVKDVGALYYSVMDLGLGRRDLLRFMREYSGGSLRETLSRDAAFWRAVRGRARRLYGKSPG